MDSSRPHTAKRFAKLLIEKFGFVISPAATLEQPSRRFWFNRMRKFPRQARRQEMEWSPTPNCSRRIEQPTLAHDAFPVG